MIDTTTYDGTARLNEPFLSDFIQRWTAAWNSHHADDLLALMTDDIVYDDSAWPTTMYGHAAVRQFLAYVWRAFPDLTFEILTGPYIASDRAAAAVYWHGTGTMLGPIDPPGFSPTGQRIDFEGADFYEFRDGRVARLRIVFDMSKLARQIGAAPTAGSRTERIAVLLQRLHARRTR